MPASLPAVIVAIALFALLATFVEPSINSSDRARLDATAEQLAALIRAAQAEAIRTGQHHGVIYDVPSQSFSVIVADTSVEPFIPAAISYHPVSKQPLIWNAGSWISLTPGANIFSYESGVKSNQLLFDSWGTPLLPVGGITRQLTTTTLTLKTNNHTQQVTITPINGYVSLL